VSRGVGGNFGNYTRRGEEEEKEEEKEEGEVIPLTSIIYTVRVLANLNQS
jgi:hypothetical protein